MSEEGSKGDDSGKLLYCSFCGKSQHEVRKLIAGHRSSSAMNASSYVTTLFAKRCRGSAERRVREATGAHRNQRNFRRVRDRSDQAKKCSLWRFTTTISG